MLILVVAIVLILALGYAVFKIRKENAESAKRYEEIQESLKQPTAYRERSSSPYSSIESYAPPSAPTSRPSYVPPARAYVPPARAYVPPAPEPCRHEHRHSSGPDLLDVVVTSAVTHMVMDSLFDNDSSSSSSSSDSSSDFGSSDSGSSWDGGGGGDFGGGGASGDW